MDRTGCPLASHPTCLCAQVAGIWERCVKASAALKYQPLARLPLQGVMLAAINGDVGDHALVKCNLLNLTRHLAQIDYYPVNFGHPHQRVCIQ